MNLKEALKRIEELEARVRALELVAPREVHHHYELPTYVPQPITTPLFPQWYPPIVTCCSGSV